MTPNRMTAHLRSPEITAKRNRMLKRIRRYRIKHGIGHKTKLTKQQLLEARGGAPLPAKILRRFKKGAQTVKGSISLEAIRGQKPPKQGSAYQRATYLTSQRISFGNEVVKLVGKAMTSGDRTLAGGIVMMVNRLLGNGGAH